MKGSHWTKKLCGRKLQWEEETLVLLQDWNSLRLVFFFLPSSLCRREIERRGERRRPQVTFLDYQLNAWGEWERKKEREWRRREVGIGWGKGKGVEKRSDVFISFRLCLVAAGSGFSPHLVAHCLVTAKCVKTPPTTSWRPREREQGSLS